MDYESSPAFQELEGRFAATLRGRLIGRRVRARLLKIAIEVAPTECMEDGLFHDRVKAGIYREFGNPLLVMILIPIITELVKLMIKWWLERQNSEILAAWQSHAS